MRIGINARYLQKQKTGIENHLLNVLLNLKSMKSRDEYVLFFGNDRPIPDGIVGDNFMSDVPRMRTDSQLRRLIWSNIHIPRAISGRDIDVFHEPSFVAPLVKRCPTVITVYDLAFLFHPECFTARNVWFLKMLLPLSIKNADRVIAISQSTRNDILNTFKIPEEKVSVIYCGTDDFFRRVDDISGFQAVRRAYGITRPFLLNVSLITPRKNLLTLLKAFKILKDGKKYEGQLVLAGGKGWLSESVFAAAREFGLENDVVFTGYVPDERLLLLYNNADVFVYPSLYEGFGLPVIEAMKCGCPVVTSSVSSLPEVAGNAAVTVDPQDAAALADGIISVTRDGRLREAMVSAGYKNAHRFSWRQAAEQTYAVYRSLA